MQEHEYQEMGSLEAILEASDYRKDDSCSAVL